MDSEDKRKLDRVLKLAEENNEYVREVRSSQKTSQMWKSIYWVLIIVAIFAGYQYIQPYLSKITQMYSTVTKEKANLELNISDGKSGFMNFFDGIMTPKGE